LTAEWIDELSSDRYRPMMRLLDPGEIDFLRSQPGYSWQIESQLRAQHRQVFRGYLRCLQADFGRICAALQLVMAQSQQDRSFVALQLMERRMAFAGAMLAVEFRLVLYGMGIGGVDVTSLVQTFEEMRVELRELMPADVACA
jgi:hypothetical protein